MKYFELEELLVMELLEVGRRLYQAALDECAPGTVLASVIDADGQISPDRHLRAHRLITRLDLVEVNQLGDEERLHPLEAEWDRFINTACDVWAQNQERKVPLMKPSER